MASHSSSSSYPILCASFNQDNSCFAIGTRDGFKIFDSNTGRLCYERGNHICECMSGAKRKRERDNSFRKHPKPLESVGVRIESGNAERGLRAVAEDPTRQLCDLAIGAFIIVEMLYSSSLLAIVGAGEQPSLSPRRLCLFNTTTGTALRELNFLTSVLAVCINRKRLIVVLQEKTYVYDTNSLAILDTIDTVPNLKGLCAFSPSLDGCFLALPASTAKGSVLVYNVMELHSHCEIDAHRSPLAAMVLSSNGMYIATASEQGTIIRVHLISEATKVKHHKCL
ncbi:hypothetical protein RHMOL_Rhmol03G0286700 [Rhododendron molle]|uniref:Uncharacterized protein n=1 Tax=Rhododendron molle TaxID=49168 RepID=A0ACC0PMM8_RHOML|nr:hypothetical protein RHMOL_Rhmol03G0286700 [Rhododendron molle]